MFQPTWTSSGNTNNIQNTWEEIISIKHCKRNESHFDRDISTTKPHFIPSKLDYSKMTNINFQGL